MSNFNLNGLTDPILPNVYIHKVTLEGADAAINKIAANKKSVIEQHISEGTQYDEDGEPIGWHGNPDVSSFSKPKLIVTYDLFLEVDELQDNFGMFLDDIFSYVDVHVITFKGKKGIKAYKHFLHSGQGNTGFNSKMTLGRVIHFPGGGLKKGYWPTYWGEDNTLQKHKDYMYGRKNLNVEIDESLVSNAAVDPSEISSGPLKQKIDFIKEKYRHIMPDGRTIYKIPARIKHEIEGTISPTSLSAIAVCTLNMDSLKDKFEAESEIANLISDYALSYGRMASEVILKGGAIPKKGMLFFISTNQDTSEFDNVMGTLWMGGVHKHGDRFMAGNKHDDDVAHPYLDYVMVDNSRVHDFRLVGQIKKQILNFESEKNMFFGGNYVNNQLTKTVTADFSDLACFGPLLSSINTERLIKLSFCIDWGKLIKKHCVMPAVLDSFITNKTLGGTGTTFWFNKYSVPNILSFKVYRERVDTDNDIINDTGRKLVYSGYPNIYYTSQIGTGNPVKFENKEYDNPKLLSALVPLNLHWPGKDLGPQASHIKHYTFTDYDIESVARGVFQYSLEVEIKDPTLNYILETYSQINEAVNALKPFVSFVSGKVAKSTKNKLQKPVQIFDQTMGAFTPYAKAIFNEKNFIALAIGQKSTVRVAVEAISKFALYDNALNINEDDLMALIDVTKNATPDSIIVFNDLLISMVSKLKSVVESYSTAKIPKISSFGESGVKEKALSGQTVAATIPVKKIKAEHVFDDPTELVDVRFSEAGYDFFGGRITNNAKTGIKNRTSFEIGMKSIFSRDYMVRSKSEFAVYWPTKPTENLTLPMPQDLDPALYPTVGVSLTSNVGRFLTVPVGATYVPKYVVSRGSHNNEDTYWMAINNILRYKFGLQGDYGADHRLGYGPDDKIAGSLGITAQMERILKEYQTLASLGVYFPQDSVVDQSHATDIEVSSLKTKGDGSQDSDNTFSWEGKNNPFPSGISLEKEKNTKNSIELMKSLHVPWAHNYGQEKLLLSLINGTVISLATMDSKLGAFDPKLKGSKFDRFIREYYTVYGPENLLIYFSKNIPHQTWALIANLNTASQKLLAGEGPFRYYKNGGNPQLYEMPVELPGPSPDLSDPGWRDQDMKIDKFGQFWFNHMNVAEVQFFVGFEQTELPGKKDKPTKYEEYFNASAKVPKWAPLDLAQLENISKDLDAFEKVGQKHLLCRLVKKKLPFFNMKAYEALDLPLYDEHFLITTEHQAGFGVQGAPKYNAYISSKPDENKGAGSPEFVMVHGYSEGKVQYGEIGEEIEDIIIGTIE